MTTTINADTVVGGAIVTGDASGSLGLQAAGTTLLTLSGSTATFAKGYTEAVYALGTSGSLELNPANGTVQTCTLSGAPTFTDSLSSGQSIVLRLANGSSYTVTYPTMTWVGPSGNVAPTLNAGNVLVFWKIGTTLYGANVGKYS